MVDRGRSEWLEGDSMGNNFGFSFGLESYLNFLAWDVQKLLAQTCLRIKMESQAVFQAGTQGKIFSIE